MTVHNSCMGTCLFGFYFYTQGNAEDTIPNFVSECGASLLVTDFSPLREVRKCKEEICKRVSDFVTIHEVDAHNVVPLWAASEKLEYSARTIRNKINKNLPEYLIEFPMLQPPVTKWVGTSRLIDWDSLIDEVLRLGVILLWLTISWDYWGFHC